VRLNTANQRTYGSTPSGKDSTLASSQQHHAKATHKMRKYGRNKRRNGIVGELSTYRLRHAIPAGPRSQVHEEGRCPVHAGRMTNRQHLVNWDTNHRQVPVTTVK
jgi:hypothetical protein